MRTKTWNRKQETYHYIGDGVLDISYELQCYPIYKKDSTVRSYKQELVLGVLNTRYGSESKPWIGDQNGILGKELDENLSLG